MKKALSEVEKQKAVAAKREEELKSVSRANENREKVLKAEIDRLIDQSKKDKEELTKVLEKTQQVILEMMIIKKLTGCIKSISSIFVFVLTCLFRTLNLIGLTSHSTC